MQLDTNEINRRIVEFSATLATTKSAVVRKHHRFWIAKYQAELSKRAAPVEVGHYRLLTADEIFQRKAECMTTKALEQAIAAYKDERDDWSDAMKDEWNTRGGNKHNRAYCS